jgi:sulfotransferase family protein
VSVLRDHLADARLLASMPVTRHILVVNGHKVRQPVFVLGGPHTGTELLARALKQSGSFHVTIGRPNVLRVIYAFARRPSIPHGRGDAAARVLRDAFAEAWQISAEGCIACAPQCRQAGFVNGVGPCVNMRSVGRYGDASPDLLYCAHVLLDAFPDAQLVQLVRDGRDVVAEMLADEAALAWFRPSLANVDTEFPNPFFGIETEAERAKWPTMSLTGKCALRWRGAVRFAARLRQDLAPGQLTTLRYEDLVRQPRQATVAVSDFLGAPASVIALQAVRSAGVGVWRHRLTKEQLNDVEKVAGEDMRRIGYG